VNTEHPLIKVVSASAEKVFGRAPHQVASASASDMAKWIDLGVPTLIYGPGNVAVAHTPNEWVSLDTTLQVAQVLMDACATLLAHTTLQLAESDPTVSQLREVNRLKQQIREIERQKEELTGPGGGEDGLRVPSSSSPSELTKNDKKSDQVHTNTAASKKPGDNHTMENRGFFAQLFYDLLKI
jgi:Peptidase family M20/M25/M40